MNVSEKFFWKQCLGCLVASALCCSFQELPIEQESQETTAQDVVIRIAKKNVEEEKSSSRVQVTEEGNDVYVKILGVDVDVKDPPKQKQKKKKEKKIQSLPPVCKPACFCPAESWTRIQRFALGVDFLYFQPTEDGLIYGRTHYVFANPMKDIQQDFSYEPGARVFVSFPVGHDDWKVSAVYTYFGAFPKSTQKETPDPVNSTLATQGSLTSGIYTYNDQLVSFLKGTWSLRMNAVSVDLGRPFQVGTLLMEPKMGIKGAYINQVMNINYVFDRLGITGYTVLWQTLVGQSVFRGIGPEAVLNVQYLMPKKFSFSLRGAYSCLWGVFDLSTKYKDYIVINAAGATGNVDSASPSTPCVILKERDTRLSSVVELQLGLSKAWVYGKKQNKFIDLTVGWETQVWGDQMRVLWCADLNPAGSGSNLNLSGPFARYSMSF